MSSSINYNFARCAGRHFMSSTHMKGRNSLTEREILWDYKCNFASVNTWFIGDLRNSMIVHVDVLTSTMAPAEPLEA